MDGFVMKRYNNLYNFSYDDIECVYRKVRRNTKNKRKIKKFEDYYSININKIKDVLDKGEYEPGRYNIFLIREPKYRIVMSQNIFDKVINHLVSYKILLPVLDNSLIDMNIATRIGRGTHYGIRKLKRYLNDMSLEIYALKFDISKFFYNIDHDVLISLLKDKIKDVKALDILIKIIRSTDEGYVNERINYIKERAFGKGKSVFETSSLPLYEKGKGLPIGNMTSQILAIYYLNELDHFIKEKLHIKYYIRYMDDGVLLSGDKDYLRYCKEEIEKILGGYKLRLNDKTKIINVSKEGIDFLGFRFYVRNGVFLKVRKFCKKRFKKAICNGELSTINSYKAHFKWGNCYNLVKKNIKIYKK